jgi:hypothetical protein
MACRSRKWTKLKCPFTANKITTTFSWKIKNLSFQTKLAVLITIPILETVVSEVKTSTLLFPSKVKSSKVTTIIKFYLRISGTLIVCLKNMWILTSSLLKKKEARANYVEMLKSKNFYNIVILVQVYRLKRLKTFSNEDNLRVAGSTWNHNFRRREYRRQPLENIKLINRLLRLFNIKYSEVQLKELRILHQRNLKELLVRNNKKMWIWQISLKLCETMEVYLKSEELLKVDLIVLHRACKRSCKEKKIGCLVLSYLLSKLLPIKLSMVGKTPLLLPIFHKIYM